MCPQKFTQNVHENSPKKRTCHGQAVKAISSPGVTTPCCYEFKKKLNSIVQWLIVADCAMAESLARICIICLAIILELSAIAQSATINHYPFWVILCWPVLTGSIVVVHAATNSKRNWTLLLIVADCAMAESLARICIICLAIILELSPQDIVLHINVKSEIIPLVVVACGIWWKNEIGRKLHTATVIVQWETMQWHGATY